MGIQRKYYYVFVILKYFFLIYPILATVSPGVIYKAAGTVGNL